MSQKNTIITSEKAAELMSYILPFYDNDKYVLYMFQSMGLELDRLSHLIGSFYDQSYPDKATWSLSYWEQLFGLNNGEGKSDAARRDEIIAYVVSRPPINKSRIRTIAEHASGVDAVVYEWYSKYTFHLVLISDDLSAMRRNVWQAVYEAKPAHLKAKYYVKIGDEIHEYDPDKKSFAPVIKHRPNIGKGLTIKPTLKLSAGESLGTGVFHRSSEVRSGPFIVGPSSSRRRNVNVSVGNDINTGKHKAQPIKTHTQQTSRATSNKFALSTQSSSGSSQLGYCGMDYSKGGG